MAIRLRNLLVSLCRCNPTLITLISTRNGKLVKPTVVSKSSTRPMNKIRLPAKRHLQEDPTSDVDDSELGSSSPPLPSLPPPPPSIPPIQALIQTSVLFDGKALFNEAKLYASGAFDFDAFISKEVSMVVKYTNERGYSYHRVAGSATIEADRVKAVTCDLDNAENWVCVESIVDNYHQQKKKNLHVTIVISYIRWIKGIEVEPDVNHSSNNEPVPALCKKRRIATEKQKEEAEAMQVIDKACGNAIGDLLRCWHCEKRSCINYGKAYYVIGVDHIHLNSSDLAVWNTSIKYEKATLEVPTAVEAGCRADAKAFA